MTIRFQAVLALCFSVLTVGSAAAKTTPHTHHTARHVAHRKADVRYAQGVYDYRAASRVREEFRDGPGARDGRFTGHNFYRGRREGMVVENLRSGDFTGGVGYGLNGDVPSFVDGYGQTHFFVGSFRQMAPVAGFGTPRSGFRRGF